MKIFKKLFAILAIIIIASAVAISYTIKNLQIENVTNTTITISIFNHDFIYIYK